MHASNADTAAAINNAYIEPDTFWFDPGWCLRHPDAPVAPAATAAIVTAVEMEAGA